MALLDTLQEKRSQILEVAAKHGAFNVRVFGLVVRGKKTPESDMFQAILETHKGNIISDSTELLCDDRSA